MYAFFLTWFSSVPLDLYFTLLCFTLTFLSSCHSFFLPCLGLLCFALLWFGLTFNFYLSIYVLLNRWFAITECIFYGYVGIVVQYNI